MARFAIIQSGTGFTSLGPTPDKVISFHRKLEVAQKAFAKLNGPARLIEYANGKTVRIIDTKLA